MARPAWGKAPGAEGRADSCRACPRRFRATMGTLAQRALLGALGLALGGLCCALDLWSR